MKPRMSHYVTPEQAKADPSSLGQAFSQMMREYYEWFDKNQEILILWGKDDPRLDPEFMEEWNRMPPPLASENWS